MTGAVHFSFDNAAEFFNKSDGALVNNVTIDIDLLALSLPGAWGPLVMTYLNGLGCPLTGRSNSLNSLVRP